MISLGRDARRFVCYELGTEYFQKLNIYLHHPKLYSLRIAAYLNLQLRIFEILWITFYRQVFPFRLIESLNAWVNAKINTFNCTNFFHISTLFLLFKHT